MLSKYRQATTCCAAWRNSSYRSTDYNVISRTTVPSKELYFHDDKGPGAYLLRLKMESVEGRGRHRCHLRAGKSADPVATLIWVLQNKIPNEGLETR
jgi:hypothetical protein